MSAPITKLTPTSLSSLLCARICHDLISPVGALGTAVEILDDDDNVDMHEDALELVRTASRQASAKLKFLRLAFGAAGSAPGVIATSEVTQLSNAMFADSKPDLIWDIDADGIDKNHARILLNLIMLAVQAAPRGGTVTIKGQGQEAGAAFTVVSDGPKARLEPAIAKAIAGKAPEDGFDGRSIQPLYASLLARDIGGSLGASADETTITFTGNFPA
jgi:histidine phosphotransferase ChpT